MESTGSNVIEFRVGQVEIRCSGEAEWVSRQAGAVLRSLQEIAPEQMRGADEAVRAASVGDLLARSHAETFGDKAGVIAYWLQEQGGRARWRSGEIVKELEKLGERIPTNITDALQHKVRRGYFVTNDRMWELTPAGRSWVLFDLLGEREPEEIIDYPES